MKKLKYLILLALPILMMSCSKEAVTGTEDEQINNYIASNKLTVTLKTASGLRYCKTSDGSGAALKAGQNINVDYAGNLMNGKKFDSGNFSFILGAGRVVAGFDEGIAKMKVGEKAIIIFPSNLGYGANGTGSIPGGAPLAFTITVVSAK
jgi:FKBP-type peptidyl-prolyl cis-trans isomerase